VVAASIATLLINQFWTGLFALPGTPHYFALFAWGPRSAVLPWSWCTC
jgi:hypothetical protein